MAETQTVKVGKRGVVTLPKSYRDRYGIEEGDALHLVDLGGGAFVATPMMPIVPDLAAEIEMIRETEGLSLDTLLDRLRAERQRLVRERYGDPPEEAQNRST